MESTMTAAPAATSRAKRAAARPPAPQATPIARAVQAKAVQLHDEIIVLMGQVVEMDPRFGHATTIIEQALSVLVNTQVVEPGAWNGGARQTDSLIRGALAVGDAMAGQCTLLRQCLSSIAGLIALTDGVDFESTADALETVASGRIEVLPLRAESGATAQARGGMFITSDRINVGMEACWLIQPMCDTAADLLDEFRTSTMQSTTKLAVMADMMRRAARLAGVPMSVLDDDDDIDGLTRRLEGRSA